MEVDWFNVIYEVFPFLFVAIISVWAYSYFGSSLRNVQRKNRLRRGKKAEDDARIFLEENGFEIHDYQPVLNYSFMVGSERARVQITPDFVVKKGKETYLVEVKTGEVASNPNYASTRRQMLEYSLAGDHPILFVDMEKREMHPIKFPFGSEKATVNWWKYLSLLMISCLVAALLLFAVTALLKLL